MDNIKLEYQYVVFLYSYLIQADLSLDRSKWESFEKLREYYKTQIPPEKVARHLLQSSNLSQNHHLYEGLSFLSKVKELVLQYCINKPCFTKSEIYYCCQRLFEFEGYLKSDSEISKLEIEKLRIEFSKLTFGVIQSKLRPKDRYRAQKIEHFLQNEILETIKIEEFSRQIGF